MSDVRKSVPAKVIASLLILVSVFSLCWQGMAVLRGIDYVLTDSWQDTWEFKELIREREDQLAEWFAARAALEDPGLASCGTHLVFPFIAEQNRLLVGIAYQET